VADPPIQKTPVEDVAHEIDSRAGPAVDHPYFLATARSSFDDVAADSP